MDYFWWGAVFLINVPVAIVLLATSPLFPEYRNKDAKRLDVIQYFVVFVGIGNLGFWFTGNGQQWFQHAVWWIGNVRYSDRNTVC